MTSASVSASVSATAEELPGCDTLGRGDVFVAAFAWSTMIITGTGGTGACVRYACALRGKEMGRTAGKAPYTLTLVAPLSRPT